MTRPVLLLIPGMLNTPAIWSRVVPLLGDVADVRVADVTTQSAIAEMARDAWSVLADVPAGTQVVACGFSMGGYVLLEMLAHPARPLAAIGLLDTSSRPETPEGAAVREKTIAAIERNFPKVVEGLLGFMTHPSAQADAALIQELREIMLAVGGETAIRQNRAVIGRGDYRALLLKLDLPALVMCGTDDKVTVPDMSRELASLLPRARLEWLGEAGHMTPFEQPARVAALLRELVLAAAGSPAGS